MAWLHPPWNRVRSRLDSPASPALRIEPTECTIGHIRRSRLRDR